LKKVLSIGFAQIIDLPVVHSDLKAVTAHDLGEIVHDVLHRHVGVDGGSESSNGVHAAERDKGLILQALQVEEFAYITKWKLLTSVLLKVAV